MHKNSWQLLECSHLPKVSLEFMFSFTVLLSDYYIILVYKSSCVRVVVTEDCSILLSVFLSSFLSSFLAVTGGGIGKRGRLTIFSARYNNNSVSPSNTLNSDSGKCGEGMRPGRNCAGAAVGVTKIWHSA